MSPDGVRYPDDHYRVDLAADIDVPAEGGYTFTVIANDGSSVAIDGMELGKGPTSFLKFADFQELRHKLELFRRS